MEQASASGVLPCVVGLWQKRRELPPVGKTRGEAGVSPTMRVRVQDLRELTQHALPSLTNLTPKKQHPMRRTEFKILIDYQTDHHRTHSQLTALSDSKPSAERSLHHASHLQERRKGQGKFSQPHHHNSTPGWGIHSHAHTPQRPPCRVLMTSPTETFIQARAGFPGRPLIGRPAQAA